jgi:type IV secretory pathway TraG/TraD family ATPase VirD4
MVMGVPGSGKTLCIRMLMGTALLDKTGKLAHRALVYDPKRDLYPVLRGMGLAEDQVLILNPFDTRGVAWDIAQDVTTEAQAQQLARALVPEDKREAQRFFSDAARDICGAAILALIHKAPGRWKLNDLLELCLSPPRLLKLLLGDDDGKDVADIYLTGTGENKNVISTLRTRLAPFAVVARLWARTEKKVSLAAWAKDTTPRALLIGRVPEFAAALEPLTRAIFKRVTDLVTSRTDTDPVDQTWLVLDEARVLGKLDGLTDVLLEGRSKGAHVVLGFQNLRGLMDVYGEHATDELLGSCGNKAILKLDDPASFSWASKYFAKYEYIETSVTDGTHVDANHKMSTSRSINYTPKLRDAVIEQDFRNLNLAHPERGIEGLFAADFGAWAGTIPPSFIAKYLAPSKSTVEEFSPRPAGDQKRVKIDDALREYQGVPVEDGDKQDHQGIITLDDD